MLPSSVKVGACTWDVLECEVEADEMGHCDFIRHTIHIDKDLSEDAKEETFIHELLHVCCYAAGCQDSKSMDEEDFVGRISYLLHSALKDNGFWPN